MLARLNEAKDRQIVSFRAAAGEDDLRRSAAKQARNGFPGSFHRGPGMLSMMMNGRSVAELIKIIRTHCFEDLRQKRSRSIAIQVHPAHRSILVVDGHRRWGKRCPTIDPVSTALD